MGEHSYRFLTLVCFCLCWSFTTSETCNKINSCKCVYPDGRYIDLTPLASLNDDPKWKDNYDQFYNNRFSYNPCYSFTESSCQDVAVCQLSNAGQYFECGNQESSRFLTDVASGMLAIEYSNMNSTSGLTRYSRVVLNCIFTSQDTLEIRGEGQTGHYGFVLNSQHCCPKQGPTTDPPGGEDLSHLGLYLMVGFGVVLISTVFIGLICYLCGRPSHVRGHNLSHTAPVRGQHPYTTMDTSPPPYVHT